MSADAAAPRPVHFPIFLALAVWFGVLLFFFSRHNDFPVYYHLDEPSKGEQILQGQYNYHHPLLLLDTATLLLRVSGLPRTLENTVVCGRWVSAIFSALSVVFLTLLAGRRAGWKAAVACGLLLPAHPLIYELAHYCKEDPALLCGLSLSLLALDFFRTRPGWGHAAFLGAACGVAASGKYIGIVMLLVALPFLWSGMRGWKEGRAAVWGGFFAGFLAVLVVLNLPYFLHPGALFSGLRYEAHEIETGGGQGISRKVPHAFYVEAFTDNFSWLLLVGVGAFAVRLFRSRPGRAGDALLVVLPIVCVALLSFVPKTSPRYFLAVSPLLITAAGIGLMTVGEWLPARFERVRMWLPPTLAVATLVLQIKLMNSTVQGFRTDSRREMALWIATQMPQKSVVLAESRLYLSRPATWPGGQPREDLALEEVNFAPDAGTLDEIKARGGQYVAVFRSNFTKLMAKDSFKAASGLEGQFDRRQSFYRDLQARGKEVKKAGRGDVTTLNPRLILFELP